MTDVNSGDLKLDNLEEISREIINAVQLGTLEEALGVTIVGIDVQEPLPVPESMCSPITNLAISSNSVEVVFLRWHC